MSTVGVLEGRALIMMTVIIRRIQIKFAQIVHDAALGLMVLVVGLIRFCGWRRICCGLFRWLIEVPASVLA